MVLLCTARTMALQVLRPFRVLSGIYFQPCRLRSEVERSSVGEMSRLGMSQSGKTGHMRTIIWLKYNAGQVFHIQATAQRGFTHSRQPYRCDRSIFRAITFFDFEGVQINASDPRRTSLVPLTVKLTLFLASEFPPIAREYPSSLLFV